MVGDFAQAIYSWRGADYRNMLSLTSQFPDIKTYRLEQNYRSTQSILDAASTLIAQNTSHPVLSLWTEKTEGEKITVFEAGSDIDEVNFVVKQTAKSLRENDTTEVAVLYRTNAQSRAFEEGFLQAGIPYRLVGGVRFYARKEIKDLLAFLRLTVSSSDEVALGRITKLGKKKAAIFLQWLDKREQEQKQLEEKKEQEAEQVDLHTPDYLSFEEQIVAVATAGIPKHTQVTALTVLDEILAATHYLEEFDPNDEEDASRIENIQELRSVAARYVDVPTFLETVALVEEDALRKERFAHDSRVTLMSIHAAKGLEFDTVFVVGMEEGLFPHSRSLLDRHQMEEERRLCYVAITRAKEKLYISYARKRLLYGRISGTVISRFLAEIPVDVMEKKSSVHLEQMRDRYTKRSSFWKPTTQIKPTPPKQRLVRFDDPSIDDFLEGNMDISEFLKS